MENSLAFRALACIVAIAVRLVHLPVLFYWCPLGAIIGRTPAINTLIVVPVGVALCQLWRLWLHPRPANAETEEQHEELVWLLDHHDLPGFKARAWRHLRSHPALWHEYLMPIIDPILDWGAGCFIAGWLFSFIDRWHSSDPMAWFSLDFAHYWAQSGTEILDQLESVLILIPCLFVLLALYLSILHHADWETLGMMERIDRAKR